MVVSAFIFVFHKLKILGQSPNFFGFAKKIGFVANFFGFVPIQTLKQIRFYCKIYRENSYFTTRKIKFVRRVIVNIRLLCDMILFGIQCL